MTRERSIEVLEILKSLIEWDKPMECYVALETAIKVLQQPTPEEIIHKCAIILAKTYMYFPITTARDLEKYEQMVEKYETLLTKGTLD